MSHLPALWGVADSQRTASGQRGREMAGDGPEMAEMAGDDGRWWEMVGDGTLMSGACAPLQASVHGVRLPECGSRIALCALDLAFVVRTCTPRPNVLAELWLDARKGRRAHTQLSVVRSMCTRSSLELGPEGHIVTVMRSVVC